MIELREASWLEWLEGVDSFSAGYLSCDSAYHTVRLAHALCSYWTNMPAVIEPDDRLVGRIQPGGAGGFSFGSGIVCNAGAAEKLKQQFPKWREHLDELVAFWRSLEPGSRMRFPEDERFMSGQNVYWAGWGGHTVLGFEQLLAEGIERPHLHGDGSYTPHPENCSESVPAFEQRFSSSGLAQSCRSNRDGRGDACFV